MKKMFRVFWRMVAVLLVLVMGFGSMFLMVGCSDSKPDPVRDPLTAEDQQDWNRIKMEQGKAEYVPPQPGFWDNRVTELRTLQVYGDKAVKWTGRVIALSIFHSLLWLIPFFVIGVIPGFLAKNLEMPMEGALITAMGVVLLSANWVGLLHQEVWVWVCLILPGMVLFVVGWFVQEGWWKIALVFGPVAFMSILVVFGVIDTVMTMLIHGSYLVVGIFLAILAGGWMETKEGGSHHLLTTGTAANWFRCGFYRSKNQELR